MYIAINNFLCIKNTVRARQPVIIATWKAEIGEIAV
jgi:hypothetical protein